MWVNQIFGGIHWHRPVLRHPLCQLHDIKYYSSCGVNKFPVKSFPLIISVKQIYYFLRNFRKLLRIHEHWPKLYNSFPLDSFRKYLAHYSSYFSIHPPLDFVLFISFYFSYLQCLFIWKYVYSIHSIIIVHFQQNPSSPRFNIISPNFSNHPTRSIPRNNPPRNPL